MYGDRERSISVPNNSYTVVPMPTAMPAKNVTNGTNTLSVALAGVYEINYALYPSASLGASVTIAIRNNGINIPSTVSTQISGVGNVYDGSTIVTLAAGSVLDMAIRANNAFTLKLGDGVNATLSVKKLDA